MSDDAERLTNTNPPLPGRGVSEDDQRQIQAAHPVGSAGRSPALRRDQERALARRRRFAADRAARAEPQLKALAQSGLIVRKDYGVVPPKVEYRLTPAGRSFIPVIAEIRKWGARHLGGERLRVAG